MYPQITITLNDDQKEPVTATLYAHGCTGTIDEDARLIAYFPEDADIPGILNALTAFDGVSAEAGELDEQDWYAPFKATIKPFAISGITICPPWETYTAKPGEDVITMDPGQAFGAGEHVTTRMMMEFIREWAKAQEGLATKRFLDVGTGTGILAIAAYIYGLRDITTTDTQPEALETAATNFALNGMTDKIVLLPGSMKEAGIGYDFIVANIFQEVLLYIMEEMAAGLNPGGLLALSGLIEGQEVAVIEKAQGLGLRLIKKQHDAGWVSALMAR